MSMKSFLSIPKYKVILFYKFVDIKNPEKLMWEQRNLCESLSLKGRMVLAREGINATFEGKVRDVNKYEKMLKELKIGGKNLFKDTVFKESEGNGKAFSRLQIKVRDEVVTLGAGQFDVKKETAKTITATELHNLFKNKNDDFVVLDLRNDYEINAGYFEKTVNPKLENFRDLPDKLKNKELEELKIKSQNGTKIIPVCTGGIRCEKATCLLKKEGFKNLYQLKDGIHTYMQKYPGRHFKGSLFVFDNRMTTPVSDSPRREIVGECIYCHKKCEDFYSNDTVRPSRKVICCHSCAKKHTKELRSCLPV